MLKLFLNDRVKIYFKKSKPSRYIFLHHCSFLAFFSSFVHVSLTNALKRKGEKLWQSGYKRNGRTSCREQFIGEVWKVKKSGRNKVKARNILWNKLEFKRSEIKYLKVNNLEWKYFMKEIAIRGQKCFILMLVISQLDKQSMENPFQALSKRNFWFIAKWKIFKRKVKKLIKLFP